MMRDVFGCLFPHELSTDNAFVTETMPVDLSSGELTDVVVSSTDGFGRIDLGSQLIRLPKALVDSLPANKPAVVEFGPDGVPVCVHVFVK